MNEFWWATLVFVVLGVTPMLLASINSVRESRREQKEQAR